MRHQATLKNNELVSSSVLAEILSVPEATLRHWRNRETGPPYYRVGKHVRYRLSEVESWLQVRRA